MRHEMILYPFEHTGGIVPVTYGTVNRGVGRVWAKSSSTSGRESIKLPSPTERGSLGSLLLSSYVKETLLEGMSVGESLELSKIRREFLAEELGCTTHQITGLRSSLTRAARTAITLHNLRISTEDLYLATKYFSLAAGPVETAQACKELANHLRTDQGDIAAAVETFSRSLARSGSSVQRPDGSQAHFDNHVKENWRLRWEDFIARHMTRDELANARVLCLPSVNVMLEISHYLKLGIRPENILAIEGGKEHAEFARNAEAAGIRYQVGRLERILPKLDERFNIVNYDFCGPTSLKTRYIMSQTPLATKAIVILNLMAAREGKAIQEQYQDFHSLCGVRPQEWQDINAHRERDVENLTLGALGMLREPWPGAFKARLSQKLEFILFAAAVAIQEALAPHDESLSKAISNCFYTGMSLVQGYPLEGAREKCKYWSETSRSHIPYVSTFQVIHNPKEELSYPFRKSFGKLLALSKPWLENFGGTGHLVNLDCLVLDSSGKPIEPRGELSDKSCLKIEIAGKCVSTIPIGDLRQELSTMSNIVDAIRRLTGSDKLDERKVLPEALLSASPHVF